MRTTRALIGLVVSLALLAAACGDDIEMVETENPTTTSTSVAPGTSGTDGGTADSPMGRTFVSTDVTVNGEARPLVEGSELRLGFDDGQLSVAAGCNQMGGAVTLDGGRLAVTAMSSTEMACDEPLMAQDTWASEFLSGGPAWSLDGDTLVLTGDDGTVVTLVDREVAQPDSGLVGPTWTAESIIAGETASSVGAAEPATFEFAEDGTVSIHDGCNQGSGTYTVEGDAVIFSAVAFTMIGCLDLEASTMQDAVTALLAVSPVTYVIEADSLTLRTADGNGIDFLAEG